MDDITVERTNHLQVRLDISDHVLAVAIEGLLVGALAPSDRQHRTPVLITDDFSLGGRNTILVIGLSDVAASRAIDLVGRGKVGTACSRDQIHLLPELLRAIEADCIALPGELLVRAKRAPVLSDELLEMLHLVRRGKSNIEIASHFSCSIATVKRRIVELMKLFGAQNRVELAAKGRF